MLRSITRTLAALAVCAIAPQASAQIIAIPLIQWKYQQPWTQPWHSHPSVVRDCNGLPVQFAPVCFDDWICTSTGPIVRVVWWGTSPQPQQVPNRNFYIAIYSDAQCRPQQLLYKTCVLASSAPVALDCRDRRVYKFTATLPTGAAGFSQTAGTHYWLQISEIDGAGLPLASPTPNATDFEWSAHRPIKNCPAARRLPSGVFQQPLFDLCDNIEEDLSFILYRKAFIGHIDWPHGFIGTPALPAPVFTAEIRRLDGELMASECISPNEDGSFALESDLPPGAYRIAVTGMSFRPAFFDIFYDDGTDIVNLPDICCRAGDVDGDGDTDFGDITGVLGGWRP